MIGDLPEDDLRLIADLGTQLAGIAAEDGRFLWLSSRWETVLGWPRQALIDAPFLEFVHPDDHAATRAQLERLTRGREVTHFVNRFRDVDGRWISLEWDARHAPDGRIVFAARDVTERRAAVARQQQLVAQLHQAESLAALGHWRLDLATRTVFWSPQVYSIHGRDPSRGPPALETAIEYYHPDDRAAVRAAIAHTQATHESYRLQLRIIREDGVERTVESRGDVEVDDAGTIVGLFGVFQDVTEQSLLRERLRHVDRLTSVGVLASGVAHEVNNPLTYVIQDAVQLEDRLDELADWMPQRQLTELTRLAREIRDGARRIKRIVRGLREVAAPDLGTQELIDLRLAAALARQRTELDWRYRAGVEIDVPADLPLLRGEETHVQQVLRNLVVNAAHAMPEGEAALNTIWISAGRCGPTGIWLEVADDGVGMSAEVLARATDPFYSTKAELGGTGLGLYLVQGLVESLGGTMAIRSEPGQGTTVRLELPGTERPAPGAAPAGPPPARLPEPAAEAVRARVFVIDDQPQVARAIGNMIRGHDVAVFTEPEAALAAIDGGDRPDVLFCDLMMPGLTGKDVYDALDPVLRERFWLVTGGGVTATTRRFQASLGDRVLLKPPEARRLREVVSAVLADA